MTEWLAASLDWVAANPGWALALLFLIAFAEGLVGAGLIVPGAVLLFATGVLIGGGHLPLWPSLAAAYCGAVLGDSVSYGLGARYGPWLRGSWPLRRYPGVLDKGIAFFQAHGAKSVILGRFVGPIRGIIPAVAGMMHMPPGRFMLANLLSAVVWAPAYLFPGMVLGASMAVAMAVTTRLLLLLAMVLLALWLLWWVWHRHLRRLLRRWGTRLAWQARRWGRMHPLLGQALWPSRQAFRALGHHLGQLWWVAVALLAVLSTRIWLLGGPTLPDESILGYFQFLLPAGLHQALWLPALLVDAAAWAPALAIGLLWLILQGRVRVVLALGGAVVLAWAGGWGLGWWLGAIDVEPLYPGAPAHHFPDPDMAALAALLIASVVLATATYGVLRRPLLLLGGLVLLGVAGAAVLVGRVWVVDALGGFLLGAVAAGLVVLARLNTSRRRPERPLPLLVVAVLVLAGGLHAVQHTDLLRERIALSSGWPVATLSDWLTGELPAGQGREQRWLDGGRRPVDFQWLTGPSELERKLDQAGWQAPDRGLTGALRWLQPEPGLEAFPPLPRWHRGRLPALVRVLPVAEDKRWVLRLWPATLHLVDTPQQLWLGSLEQERVYPGWPVVWTEGLPVDMAEKQELAALLAGEGALLRVEPGLPARVMPLLRPLPEPQR